ncbi:MAG: hypothetical protein OEY95_04200 [Candidatus Bathyarchaeota archaeon]|nr:hypothetical protein [Candidatus Bathyarchaeota archaeon]
MVYYVVYKASKNHNNRSLIPARLRAIGCRQINKTFWEFDKEKVARVLKLLEKNQPVLLKRTREVKKRLIVKGVVQDLGSLIVVSIKAPKDEKEKIRKLVKKAPCIRLCRRVYAFYQRRSRFDSENKLIDARRLVAFVKGLGGRVELFPKVVIPNERLVQRLVDETRQHVEKEIFDIIQNCMRLYDQCLKNECDSKQFNDVLRKLRRQFVIVKRKAGYYEKWMGLDFSKSLMRAYRALIKLKRYSGWQKLVA